MLHDFSASRVLTGTSNMFGKNTIGKNSFVGVRSIIMHSVELGDNIIVAAGSFVTKMLRECNVVVEGNLARII